MIRKCEFCGYTTGDSSNFCKHKKTCKQKRLLDSDTLLETIHVKELELDRVKTELECMKTELERVKTELEYVKTENVDLKTNIGSPSALVRQLEEKDRQIQEKDKQIHILLTRRRADAATGKRRTINKKERMQIVHRQNYQCTNPLGLCCLPDLKFQNESYEIDHIVPKSQGGDDSNSNLQALCPGCHDHKTRLERQQNAEDNASYNQEVLEQL